MKRLNRDHHGKATGSLFFNSAPEVPERLMMALEPRILLDAAGLATAIDENQAEIDSSGGDAPSPTNEPTESGLFQDYLPPSVDQPRELLFIDTGVPGYRDLIGELDESTQVVVLDADRDGIEQMTGALLEAGHVRAVHLLSHGGPGSIGLTSGALNGDNLADYADQFQQWRQVLTDDADFLIHGCDIAAGADVAASEDTTGAAHLGGDWELEYQSGPIETTTPEAFLAYDGILVDNVAPTITAGGTATFTEGDTPAPIIDANIIIDDPDSPELQGATISSNFQSGADQLGFIDTPMITGSWDAVNGILTLTGTDTVAGYEAALRSVIFNNSSEAPDENQRTISFTVDDGFQDSAAATSTVDVTAVNDPPTGADNTISVEANVAYAFSESDFGFTDADGQGLVHVQITGLVNNGSLQLQQMEVTLDQEITLANLNLLEYTAPAGASGDAYDSFQFRVFDGFDYSPDIYTMTIGVNAADNTPPIGGDNTITIDEDTSLSFIESDFSYSDPENDPFTKIKITTLQNAGSLTLSGTDVVLNQEINTADLANLVFTPTANANGDGYATFDFKVHDGNIYSNAANTITINVSPVNDAPSASDGTITVNEDGSRSFTIRDFGFSDTDGDSLEMVKITTLVTQGSMTLNNTEITIDQEISAADLVNTVYTPDANASGAAYATFDFQVSDGSQYGPDTYTMTIDVTAGNDLPTGGDSTITISEDGSYSFSVSDFGFSDPDGDPLEKIQIATVPGAGSLQLNDTTVTADQEILAADLANLVFTPETGATGTAYASFDFYVHDGSGYSSASNTITIDVTNVNEAPTAADGTISVNEDGSRSFAISDFGFADGDGDGLATVKITSLVTRGSMSLNNTEITIDQEISATDLVNTIYTPPLDASGNGFATFDFQVSDGTVYSTGIYTMTIDVTAANDAPTGSDTTITIDEDTSHTFAATDFGFNDGDGDPLNQIQLVSVPTAGSLLLNGTSVTVDQEIPAADLPDLVFTPDTGANGSAYASFQFLVHDGTAYSDNDNTITIDVTGINEAPSAVSGTITVAEDGSRSFSISDFGFSDPDGDRLAMVKITSLVTRGSMTLNNTEVTIDQEISASELVNTVFTPASNDSGSAYATFDFQVSDGTVYSTNTYTMTIDVTASDDPPTGGDVTVTIDEDASYTFTTADFGFNDPEGAALNKIQITAVPEFGSLLLNNSTVTVDQEVLSSDLDNGYLIFTPEAGANGTAYADFQFLVHDGNAYSDTANILTIDINPINDPPTGADNTITVDAGVGRAFSENDFGFNDADGDGLVSIKITALPGVDSFQLSGTDVTLDQEITLADLPNLVFTPSTGASGPGYASFQFMVYDGFAFSASSNTLTVDINSTGNTAPTAADQTALLSEDTPYTFSTGDFGFVDANGDSLMGIKITALPGNGTLALSGSEVSTNQVISDSEISLLTYTGDQEGFGTAYDSFEFQVYDGSAYSTNSYFFDIDITGVNDAPTAANSSVQVTEDTDFTFLELDFNFFDVDGDPLDRIQIISLPTSGSLTLNNSTVTIDQEIISSDIPALTFVPAADVTGDGASSFDYKVHDGTVLSTDSYTMTLDVTPVNDAPLGGSTTITVLEDGSHTFASGDFGFTDADGATLERVRIVSLPGLGELALDGTPVTLDQEIVTADLGLLVFTPTPDSSGTGFDSFDFKVYDGTTYSINPNTITLDVTPVNDGPTAGNATVTVTEDTDYTFMVEDFNFSDADNDTLDRLRITSLPTAGSLTLNGVEVILDQEITNPDIGLLTFTPETDASGNDYSRFQFQVHDGTAYGTDTYTMTVDVTAQNDPPLAANNTIRINEDTSYTFSSADFGFSDTEGGALERIRITALPATGSLALHGATVTLDQEIAAGDLNLLTFIPTANSSGDAFDSFDFQVYDGSTYSIAPYTITLDVTPVNDPPTASNATLTLNEDGSHTFSTADFNFSDTEGGALERIRIQSLPTTGSLTFNGVTVTVEQEINGADLGSLVFMPTADASGDGFSRFTYQVHDGTTYSANTYTVTLNVNPVNDAPLGADGAITILEDGSYTFSSHDFGFSDVEGASLDRVRITTLPGIGSLTLYGDPVSVNQDIAAGDLNRLVFTPTANQSGDGFDSFDFQVSDGTDFSPAAYTITLNVTPVNDVPQLTSGANQTFTGDSTGITVDPNFTLIDADGTDLQGASVQIQNGYVQGLDELTFTPSGAVTGAWDGTTGTLTLTGADSPGTYETVLRGVTYRVADGHVAAAGTRTMLFSVNDGQATTTATATITVDSDHLAANDMTVQDGGLTIPSGSTFTLSDGALDGTGAITILDTFTWTGGTIGNSGGFSISSTSQVDISGTTDKVIQDARLSNSGRVSWTEGNITLSGSSDVYNDAAAFFDIKDDLNITAGSDGVGNRFANLGTLNKSGGTGTSLISVPFENSGTLQVDTGTLRLSAGLTQTGTMAINSGARVVVDSDFSNDSGGVIKGSGTLDVANIQFTNHGTISPGFSPETLYVEGDLNQADDGTLEIELAGTTPGSEYDQIIVSGTASLDGTLDLQTINDYQPEVGDSFEIISAAEIQGTFHTILGQDLGNEKYLEVDYDSTVVTVTVVHRAINDDPFLSDDPPPLDDGPTDPEPIYDDPIDDGSNDPEPTAFEPTDPEPIYFEPANDGPMMDDGSPPPEGEPMMDDGSPPPEGEPMMDDGSPQPDGEPMMDDGSPPPDGEPMMEDGSPPPDDGPMMEDGSPPEDGTTNGDPDEQFQENPDQPIDEEGRPIPEGQEGEPPLVDEEGRPLPEGGEDEPPLVDEEGRPLSEGGEEEPPLVDEEGNPLPEGEDDAPPPEDGPPPDDEEGDREVDGDLPVEDEQSRTDKRGKAGLTEQIGEVDAMELVPMMELLGETDKIFNAIKCGQ